MTQGQKMFFDLSLVDIQWKKKGYSICQIVQNNDLPISQVLATHLPTSTLEVEEKEELENLWKWGEFSFYVMVDYEIFNVLKKKKKLISVVSGKFKIFHF